ncbi:MAG: M23 family metallopeptidase, partial [bacterium]|nr:M23 family metallopeptidase [bacterium]
FRTLKNLADQGKLRDIEVFQFLGLADTKGLNSQYQGLIGRLSKFSGQAHNFIRVWSGKMWKLPGLNKLFPIWSKYKKGNLFFNSPLAMKLGASLGKLLGGAVAGPLGAILGYLIEDLLHKFIHNIWAGLTGGHPHALIGDNTKKMFIIGCGTVLAIIALPIFIIIIILGGAFAWLGGGSNESGEIFVNQDVVVNVRNLDNPISTIANNLTSAQDTKFDITIKNNLDKEINVWGVTISEYTEDNYWKDIKTMVYPKTIFDTFDDKDNFTISANGEYTKQITLPFYNAVRNNEDGRVINLHINVSYTQTDGGAGNTSGSGSLILGKVDQPIGTPAPIDSIDGIGFRITQCFGHIDPETRVKHAGLDIGTPEGQPLTATLSGVVTVCNMHNNILDRTKPGCPHQKFMVEKIEYSAYGNMVIVTNGIYTIRYAHLRDILQGPSTPSHITDGVIVNVGDVIAYSGDTGNSSGPHVHYEVRLGNFAGSVIEPLQFASFNPCK